MSATINTSIVNPDLKSGTNEALGREKPVRGASNGSYKGFVAGVFSGIAKLSGMAFMFCVLGYH